MAGDKSRVDPRGSPRACLYVRRQGEVVVRRRRLQQRVPLSMERWLLGAKESSSRAGAEEPSASSPPPLPPRSFGSWSSQRGDAEGAEAEAGEALPDDELSTLVNAVEAKQAALDAEAEAARLPVLSSEDEKLAMELAVKQTPREWRSEHLNDNYQELRKQLAQVQPHSSCWQRPPSHRHAPMQCPEPPRADLVHSPPPPPVTVCLLRAHTAVPCATFSCRTTALSACDGDDSNPAS